MFDTQNPLKRPLQYWGGRHRRILEACQIGELQMQAQKSSGERWKKTPHVDLRPLRTCMYAHPKHVHIHITPIRMNTCTQKCLDYSLQHSGVSSQAIGNEYLEKRVVKTVLTQLHLNSVLLSSKLYFLLIIFIFLVLYWII